MQIKIIGSSILDALSTPTYIAEFVEDTPKELKKELINSVNFGSQMMAIYGKHRDNMHISNVLEMLKDMESVWNEANQQ